jgi:hypothetical protein
MPWKAYPVSDENDPNFRECEDMPPAERLVSEGWQKQGTYDEPRLSELVDVYREIGLEVHLEPFNAENEEGCTGCMQSFPDQFKTIYTRRKIERG